MLLDAGNHLAVYKRARWRVAQMQFDTAIRLVKRNIKIRVGLGQFGRIIGFQSAG